MKFSNTIKTVLKIYQKYVKNSVWFGTGLVFRDKKKSSYKWAIKFTNLVLSDTVVRWLIRARKHESWYFWNHKFSHFFFFLSFYLFIYLFCILHEDLSSTRHWVNPLVETISFSNRNCTLHNVLFCFSFFGLLFLWIGQICKLESAITTGYFQIHLIMRFCPVWICIWTRPYSKTSLTWTSF